MNFQDIVDRNKEQLEILKEIEEFIKNVQISKNKCNTANSTIFAWCIKKCFTADELYDNANILYNELRETLIEIDGFYLRDTISKIRNIYSNELIERNLEMLEACYKELLRFKKSVKIEEKSIMFKDCIVILDTIIENATQLKILLEYTSIINKDLNIGVQNPPLRIRSNIGIINNETFDNIINPIEKIYTQLCMVANINEIEEPINITRVESGSISINFDGNSKICETIVRIISKFNNFLIKKFTKEGTKINLVKNLDIIVQQVDIIKEMQAAGIDTSNIKTILNETTINIFKQLQLFLLANPEAKINDKQLRKAEDTKKLLDSIKLLEDISDNNME